MRSGYDEQQQVCCTGGAAVPAEGGHTVAAGRLTMLAQPFVFAWSEASSWDAGCAGLCRPGGKPGLPPMT
jgi:hypothetical protein